MKYSNRYILLIALFQFLIFSCKKFVEVDAPKTQLINSAVFHEDATATAAVVSIYASMEQSAPYIIPFYTGLSSDELTEFSNNSINSEFYKNSLTTNNAAISNIWNRSYNFIFNANAAIEGLESSNGVTQVTKTQLLGEAKFIRAYWLFYLINLFGDIPLSTSTDYRINATSSRAAKTNVYQQIVSDLKDAQVLLSDSYVKSDNSNYSSTTAERVRPNKWAATALLARVYLYLQDWPNAETQATSIINNNIMFSLVSDVNKVYLKNSSEAIWQLMPVSTSTNTIEGSQFIPTSTPPAGLSDILINSFEMGDNRKTNWINKITVGSITYYYPYKYKIKSITPGTPYQEYSMVLRLAEQYLIRAEAKAQLNKISEAQTDLNKIRSRAGLTNTNAMDKLTLLTAIEQERQVEFFTEWGYRWLDLKRWNRVDAVLATIKGNSWQSTDSLYPIPFSDISTNPNLAQNSGY